MNGKFACVSSRVLIPCHAKFEVVMQKQILNLRSRRRDDEKWEVQNTFARAKVLLEIPSRISSIQVDISGIEEQSSFFFCQKAN